MKKNMGLVDRLIRTALAVIIIALYFADYIGGAAAVILGVIALMFLMSAASGFCPLYEPLKINTMGEKESGGAGHV